MFQARALGTWVDVVDKDNINLYYYDGSSFVAIPFQVDQRRRIELKYNVDSTGGDADAQICEYGYFDVLFPPATYTSPFADETLQPFDEISFMLWDAQGTTTAPTTTWVSGAQGTRYQIALADQESGAKRYVYVFKFSSPPADINLTNYLSYVSDCEAGCPSDKQACLTAWGQNTLRVRTRTRRSGFILQATG